VSRSNPGGNDRLTAAAGLVVLVLGLAEVATVVLGLHQHLSLHVFIGLILIPPVLLKLGSTGWRFVRYYSGSPSYRSQGAPETAMRLLAPLLVAATIVVFASGVAMGFLHGHALVVARRLHGPSSVVWMIAAGLHALVYLRRALARGRDDVAAESRRSVRGAGARSYALALAIVVGVVAGAATVPVRHHWLDLPRGHDHREGRR